MERKVLEELVADGVGLCFKKGGKVYEAEPRLTICVDGSGEVETKVEGYDLTCGDESVCSLGLDEFFDFAASGEILGAGGFGSYGEYLDDKAFKNISMEGLLKKYLPLADEFSLTCPFNVYDETHPFGVYGISEDEAKEALESIENWARSTAERGYLRFSANERAELPEFSALYEEICAEYQKFAGRRQKFREKHGGEVFFCDSFSAGKTKYSGHDGLYYLYQAADFAGTCRYLLEKMRENRQIRPAEERLCGKYAPLKGSLKRTEVSFVWHCTASAQLSRTYYFGTDAVAAEWLGKLKDDYDLCGLEDLAFYRDGKCIFSSCTHEGFHSDLTDKN